LTVIKIFAAASVGVAEPVLINGRPALAETRVGSVILEFLP
jgi:hypothetical protein